MIYFYADSYNGYLGWQVRNSPRVEMSAQKGPTLSAERGPTANCQDSRSGQEQLVTTYSDFRPRLLRIDSRKR